jgi:hypothetical protein
MKLKTKRHSFLFSDETDSLIRRLGEETQLKFCTIFENALKDYAKKLEQAKLKENV